MAQHGSGSSGSGFRRARWALGLTAILGALFWGFSPAQANPRSAPLMRSAAELIPETSLFFLEVDLRALRDRGPADAVHRIDATLAPLASDVGLNAERLRSIVMASAEDPLDGTKLPSWLLLAQDGAPPTFSKLEATFRRYTKTALKPNTVSGISYRGNRDVSVVQLPSGPALITGPAGPRLIVEAFQGRGNTPLVRSAHTELMRRVAGEGPTAFRLWLPLTAAKQRGLVEDAHLPAVPTEIAAALRLLPDHGAELGLLARCSDEETAKRLAAWLSVRLSTLAASSEVQLMGLARYFQSSRVTSDATLVEFQLAMNATDVAALLERAVGLLSTLSPHRPDSPNSSPRPTAVP